MIVRDGWPFIIAGLILTALVLMGALRWNSLGLLAAAGVFALLTLFTAFFFRNPPRTIPVNPRAIVSPADGRIVMITSMPDHEFIGGPAARISVFLSVLDVHVNRTPAAGVIDYVQYHPGEFRVAWVDKASELNERNEVGMTTESGAKLTFTQIAGLIARRIVCNLKPGDRVQAGELYGMIKFGSRMDLTIPEDWEIVVQVGEHVKGGETILAYQPAVVKGFEAEPRRARDNVDL